MSVWMVFASSLDGAWSDSGCEIVLSKGSLVEK
jgi:hypothetical protein